MRPILVVGATGLLGSEICRLLRGSDHNVRGLVRPGSPREEFLHRIGVETMQGDVKDVRSLERACRGASTVISTANAVRPRLPGDSIQSVDRDGQRALVDAARRGGVRKFIYVSVSPNLPRSTPLVRYKREIETAVRGSGMAWVIVQPAAYLETTLRPSSGFDAATGKVAVLGSGEAPVSYISIRDVAKAVAGIAGDHTEVTRTLLPMGGPETASVMDLVEAFEHDTGRRFHVVHAPAPVARGMGFLLRPFYPAFSSRLGIAAHKAVAGDVIERSDVVRMLVPRPTTIREYVRDAARAAVVDRVRVLIGGAGSSRV